MVGAGGQRSHPGGPRRPRRGRPGLAPDQARLLDLDLNFNLNFNSNSELGLGRRGGGGGAAFGPGERVGILADLDARTLRFYREGEALEGLVVKLPPAAAGTALFPVVTPYGSGSTATLSTPPEHASWTQDQRIGWDLDHTVGWWVGGLVGLVGWWVGWLVGWLVGRVVGWLVGWLVGRSVGRSVGL
jgi:hypothetical protein